MGFSFIRLYQFRNFTDESHCIDSREIFLIGENGQGKSNYLEALYLLCYGASFRIKYDAYLIQNARDEASVIGKYETELGGEREINVFLKRREAKEIRIDGKRILDRKEILLSIPCVVFSHQDLEFIIGTPSKKRRFFNQTMCMYDASYVDLMGNYKKVLRERNSLLKQKKTDLLELYNQQLIHFGFQIQEKRKKLVKGFNKVFQEHFRKISGLPGKIEIVYNPAWNECQNQNDCAVFLREREAQDRYFRTTTSGPHRDQFFYFLEGSDFCKIASTGQIRLLSIILRVAQTSFYAECSGRKPVLLVDDVLLELDRPKRERFIKSLPDYEQAFFTFLPDEEYVNYESPQTAKYQVVNGRINQWKKQATS